MLSLAFVLGPSCAQIHVRWAWGSRGTESERAAHRPPRRARGRARNVQHDDFLREPCGVRGGTRKSAARAPRPARRARADASAHPGPSGCAGSPLQLHTRSIESYLSTQTLINDSRATRHAPRGGFSDPATRPSCISLTLSSSSRSSRVASDLRGRVSSLYPRVILALSSLGFDRRASGW